MKNTLTILLLLITIQATACINEYRTKLNGNVVYTDASGYGIHYKKLDTVKLKRELSSLHQQYEENQSLEILSDCGAILIYLGRYNEAIEIYRKIENQQPDLYATASNMGTAFELIGQNDSAYHYIEKSIKINPDAHESSEWIHLKILEAKINLQNNSNYLKDNNLLGLDFGQSKKPKNPNNLKLDKIHQQIHFQLSERMTFVKPPDEIVGQLLFDLGNVIAMEFDAETGLSIYKLSQEYGYDSKLFRKRVRALQRLSVKGKLANKFWENDLVAVLIIGIIGILTMYWLFNKLRT